MTFAKHIADLVRALRNQPGVAVRLPAVHAAPWQAIPFRFSMVGSLTSAAVVKSVTTYVPLGGAASDAGTLETADSYGGGGWVDSLDTDAKLAVHKVPSGTMVVVRDVRATVGQIATNAAASPHTQTRWSWLRNDAYLPGFKQAVPDVFAWSWLEPAAAAPATVVYAAPVVHVAPPLVCPVRFLGGDTMRLEFTDLASNAPEWSFAITVSGYSIKLRHGSGTEVDHVVMD